MSLEENKAIVRRVVEAVNERGWDLLDELLVPGYVRHCQATPAVQVRSREDFKHFLQQDCHAVPDSEMKIDLLLAEGDMVAFYGTYRGTQRGQMGAFPPSGKPLHLEISGIHRLEGERLAETWIVWDNLTALTQLGHISPPKQPKE